MEITTAIHGLAFDKTLRRDINIH